MELAPRPSGPVASAEPSPGDILLYRIDDVRDAPPRAPDPEDPPQTAPVEAPLAAAPARPAIAGVAEVCRYFHGDEAPIYFISATSFNLLGIDADIGNFRFINYIDSFDGRHERVLAPREQLHQPFTSIEDINNYLLRHDAVRERLAGGPGAARLVFLMFDERTEALARALGAEVWLPPARLRGRIDSKIETVRLGERAGVPSVPGTLADVTSYAQLCRLADVHGLGRDLVVQTAYGDSGHTTYFIRDEADFGRHADAIVGKGEVKIMRRIRCLGTAIEGCATRRGTVVGPLMTELIGFPELTPYRGGWCGNEVFADAFTPEIRAKARAYTLAFGQQLRAEGYRGYFELDLLLDLDTGDLWLGELNPRITGASPMTTHATRATAGVPLFLLHLLEFARADVDVDLDALTAAWSDPVGLEAWSQMAIKHTGTTTEVVRAAPPSGVYQLADDGTVVYDRFERDHRAVRGDREAFFLRILREGDSLYEGADLGILLLPGRSMNEDHALTPRARQWIAGIRGMFATKPASRDQHEAELARLVESAPAMLYQLSYDKEAAGLHAAALAAIECLPGPARASYIAELRRGWLLYQLGRHADASAAYARATALAPAAVESRLGQMLPLMAEQRYVDAIALAREILELAPRNYLASLRLAFIRYAQGDYAAAVADYDALASAYPGDVEVKAGLGWALLKLGRADAAVALFREVLAVAPRHQAASEGFLAQSR
jgi:biotin carboxylase